MASMGRGTYWLVMLGAFAAQQLTALGVTLWIKGWAQDDGPSSRGRGVMGYYLGVHSAMALASILVTLMRDAAAFHSVLEASRDIHKRLLSAIFRTKFGFFDRTPAGQITTLFTRDVQTMDQELALFCVSALQVLANLVMATAVMTLVLPVFLLVGGVVCLGYAVMGAAYIKTSHHLKRVAAAERWPLFQHFEETLSGNVIIRAYGQVAAFADRGHELADRYNRPGMLRCASREWLALWVACLIAVVSSVAGALVVGGRDGVGMSAGAAGLVLTYSMSLTENVLFLVEFLALSQQNLGSVARVKEYMGMEQEPAEPIKELPSPTYDWPQRGHVRFRNYWARYGPDQAPVLRNVDLEIGGGQRVAIVGKAGAGKSTLARTLIRAVEAADGLIELDGVDIASLRLDLLRRLVTVVLQDPDPSLFRGSLRDNLDPQLRHTDDEMYRVLQSVGLARVVSLNFDDAVPALSQALSQAQRQLVCIARALLRKSLVIVLDEVTDGLDGETDKAVQAALRDGMAAGTTVVTVAHRLPSVADYDRVVMGAGTVVEEGVPGELLEKEREEQGASFKTMCVQSGELQLIERLAGLRT